MADNSQLDFRLKIYVLELNSAPITMAQPSTITSPPPPIATTTTVAIEVATAAVSVADYVTYVTRTIDTFNICRNDIDYRAEGNANIVLAMPQRCQVLRLPKKSKRLFDYYVRSFVWRLMEQTLWLICFSNLCYSFHSFCVRSFWLFLSLFSFFFLICVAE